jgi:hypothetical protein
VKRTDAAVDADQEGRSGYANLDQVWTEAIATRWIGRIGSAYMRQTEIEEIPLSHLCACSVTTTHQAFYVTPSESPPDTPVTILLLFYQAAIVKECV